MIPAVRYFAFASSLLIASGALAEVVTEANPTLISGSVVRVADGDTITVLDRHRRQIKVRLAV